MPAHLALVHHANQFLITNGYQDRQGIDEIVEGYAAVLRLHERHRIVVNLHLSGTLIEAALWHCPWFLEMVKELRAEGLIELVGGVYSETVMTLFSVDFNVAQLNELLFLYGEHLDCSPESVRVCWVPERVWDTDKLAPALTSRQLANGGYGAVLLDDRLLYPGGDWDPNSPRVAFDALGPFEHATAVGIGTTADGPAGTHETDAFTVHQISGSEGLSVIPISAHVRHWIPPTRLEHWSELEGAVQNFSAADADERVLVYADDLERTAGVGGWDESVIDAYDAFLRWISERDDVEAVSLDAHLASRRDRKRRPVDRGTFFELAHVWGAGEDYRRWSDAPAWAPYRLHLEAAREDLDAAENEGADKRLLELGRKHLFASTYETAWHDPGEGGRVPARWAKALASHARSCHVITAAARWFGLDDGTVDVRLTDLDRDGEEELVVANENLFAVMAPRHGGRLVALFTRVGEGGALAIGNPTDDWNTQEDLNRYPVGPANHPGALADVGFEHDEYRVSSVESVDRSWYAEMTNVQEGSALFGTRKALRLAETIPALSICYRLPSHVSDVSVESCLSPDYLSLLREGSRNLAPCDGPRRRGFLAGDTSVWVQLLPGERTDWTQPPQPRVSHGVNVRVLARTTHFHLTIGCGRTGAEAGETFSLLKAHEA